MGLVQCTECGKEISDKATVCPNCGCPVNLKAGITPPPMPQTTPNIQPQVPTKRKKGHGCLITFIIMVVIFGGFGVIMTRGIKEMEENPQKYDDSIAAKYMDISSEESSKIDNVLNDCGITKVSSFEHDELLDNTHSDGETGYRLAVNNNVDNIILYINADNTVYSLSYDIYPLYENGAAMATLQDYTFTSDEASDLMIKCEDKVKEVLKSPSTAQFPNILEWGFAKEKNIVTVQGYVDAQNSFGAEIRSNFQFIIDTDTNTIQSFIFDGQEMIQ